MKLWGGFESPWQKCRKEKAAQRGSAEGPLCPQLTRDEVTQVKAQQRGAG